MASHLKQVLLGAAENNKKYIKKMESIMALCKRCASDAQAMRKRCASDAQAMRKRCASDVQAMRKRCASDAHTY
jgi:hypothetical protein